MPKLTTRPNRTILPTDYIYAISSDGTEDGKVPYSEIIDSLGGGILPSATSTNTADYIVLLADVGTRIILGSATAANRVFTLDVSLLDDYSKTLSFENKSDYRLKIVVSNTGTMTINNSMIDLYLWKGDGVLTIAGDTSTNCTTIAGY